MSTMNERLREFISHIGLSVRKFETTIGVKNGYIRTFGEGSRSEIIETILQEYPQLNREWLLTGEGEMLTNIGIPTTQTESEVDAEDLILTPANSIRFYPDLPATASNIEDMPQEAYPQYQLMYIQGYEGCLAIPATGRSMEPTIHAGDRIIHEPYLDRFIQNGEIYVICTTTGQRMIKRLVETSRDEDGIPTFTCHSDNPDKDLYAPFTLKGDEIRALYKVRLIIPLSL